MSRQQQIKILNRLIDDLNTGQDEIEGTSMTRQGRYRKKNADFTPHNFRADVDEMIEGVRARLQKARPRGYGLSPRLTTDLFERINLRQKIADTLAEVNKAIKLEKADSSSKVNISNHIFTGGRLTARISGPSDNSTEIYSRVVSLFNTELNKLANTIGTAAEQLVGKTAAQNVNISKKTGLARGFKKRAGYWELSHEDAEGALESYLRAGINDVVDKINREGTENLSAAEVAKALNAMGENYVRIVRETDVDEMNVYVGGFHKNKQDMGDAKRAKGDLKRDAQRALDWLRDNKGPLVDMPGSDSFREIKRKKTIKKVIEPFLDIPGITVDIEDVTVKKTKTTVEHRSGKPKLKKRKVPIKKIKQTPIPKIGKGQKSPLRLMALINAKLPQTVASNMGAPRLENRTGRFAASPRVVDVQQTPQGFPSIGYTYEKNPYSVFEKTSGTRFADANRDPRDLIELSIREIAQQLTIGRFYTRRV